ncbi:hypothetical protein KDK95_31370 [Actinospica sp. MGRD01-02]|uniref:Uncharacterized protein n=1 Tax=Actinospica acidithermotolerans TaxID=2828514 RepID=A0A941IPW9_9ACTN|nr:hypothetical protein [Actinospica acidithermotolerans]MBR7830846.1 hypothetical protein [Actinospica acidithermotolerans]
MSGASSGEDTTVYSTGTRAVDPVVLRNTGSADCPDSGFIVLLLPSPVSEPEPTLEWRVDGGSWHGAYLSWDNGVVNGNASCASPCWKAGIVTLDVPAHTTYTIDLAVIFHSGLSHGFFSGAVYYTSQASLDDGAYGAMVAWAYQAGSSTGGGVSGTPSHSASTASGSRTTASAHASATGSTASASASTSASPSPRLKASAAATTPTPASPSASATPVATPSLVPAADIHSGGAGPATFVAAIVGVLLALAVGAGFVLTRRRRGNPPESGI